jgi:hypothetical protein
LWWDAADAWDVASDAAEEAGENEDARAWKATANQIRSKFRQPFLVSKTYETWDEDALEAGETDDSGFEYKDQPMSLTELLREFEELGSFEPSEIPTPPNWRPGMRIWFSSRDSDVNYRTGERTEYALHPRGSERAIKRLFQLLREKYPRAMRDVTRRRRPQKRVKRRR